VHLAARKLKQRLSLPWLAHFSDPWLDNPFVRYGAIASALNARLERSVMVAADRILFTSPETVDLVMAKYPPSWRGRTRVIPHGYDPAMYSGRAPPPLGGRKLVARYLGSFYGVRSPEPLFAALATARQRSPASLDDLRIEIVGRLDPGMNDTTNARRLPPGLVTFRDPVGYRASLELMETADLLLLVDAPANISVFLPSKLIDYLGAGRPIVALTSPGAARRVTREAGFWTASPDDLEEAATALLDALSSIRATRQSTHEREAYSVAATGRQLAAILAEVTGIRTAAPLDVS
jgi:glycosyltransferase involved in cell wall biosynthesis